MQGFLRSVALLSLIWNSAHCVLMGFDNGQIYKITSVATGKFLMVDGPKFQSGANVVAKEWNGQDTQKWMALEVPTSNSLARSGPGATFYLIPMRQQSENWPALNLSNTNGTAKISLTNLPENIEVLALNAETANLRTEVYNKLGASNQQWIPEDAGFGRIFIRNLANNQCMKNFDYKPMSLLQRLASFLSHHRQHGKYTAKPLATFDCGQSDVAEKWIVEMA